MTGDQGKIYIDSEDDELPEDQSKKKLLRVLVFSLGKENYCIDVRQAKEVMKMPETTHVPNVPAFVLGVANLRGEIISILDLHYFFGLEPQGKSQEVRVIVTDLTGEAVGLRVDRVKDTVEIDEDEVQVPLTTLKGNLAAYTKGQVAQGDEILILLDLETVLQCEDIRNLRKGESV
ncbi:MAG: chemotaxis protein CheW [Candidatus Omnitrophica bacterium]|nr:chemotaxis protein CheW [Candidatus Omnitrophota bacterium]